jgi:AcrR family transcriptional regulator
LHAAGSFHIRHMSAHPSPDGAGLPPEPVDDADIPAGALRVPPTQPRALLTVRRLLDAGEAIARRDRSLRDVTLSAAAKGAGVTLQAAYRYFASAEDLIRAGVRRRQAARQRQLIATIAARSFRDETELAEAVADFFIAAWKHTRIYPAPAVNLVVRRYYEIDADAIWSVAATICAVLPAPLGATDPAALATALVATGNVLRALMLRDPALVTQPQTRAMLVRLFTAATDARGAAAGLGAPPPPAPTRAAAAAIGRTLPN